MSLAVPDAELQAKAREVARTLATGGPTALAFTKRSLNHSTLGFDQLPA